MQLAPAQRSTRYCETATLSVEALHATLICVADAAVADTPFGTVGYRFLGNTSTIRTRDGLYATAGLILRAAPGTSVGAGYDWREKLVSGGDDSTDAMIFLSHNATDRVNIVAYALKGFDSGSPDYGFGGQITYKF